MLLAIDIGNTNISFALFHASKMARHWDIPLRAYAKSKLKADIRAQEIAGALICSVVPALTKRISGDVEDITGIKPYIIGKHIRVPMKNLYHQPRQLGCDRLVNAYAASQIYATPIIVVSAGTAITVDAVSRKKEFLGGFILPGLNLSLNGLNAHTALLPKLKLTALAGDIGRDTRSGILNAVLPGTAAAIDCLITRIRAKTGKTTRVIGTGGDIDLLKKFSKYIIEADKELCLKGVYLLSKRCAQK